MTICMQGPYQMTYLTSPQPLTNPVLPAPISPDRQALGLKDNMPNNGKMVNCVAFNFTELNYIQDICPISSSPKKRSLLTIEMLKECNL